MWGSRVVRDIVILVTYVVESTRECTDYRLAPWNQLDVRPRLLQFFFAVPCFAAASRRFFSLAVTFFSCFWLACLRFDFGDLSPIFESPCVLGGNGRFVQRPPTAVSLAATRSCFLCPSLCYVFRKSLPRPGESRGAAMVQILA